GRARALTPVAQPVVGAARCADGVRGAGLVVTGEGGIDRQSAYGKLTGAVTAAARAAGVPVVAVVGGVGAGHESAGLGDIAVASEGVSLEEAMLRPLPLIERAAERLVRAHASAGPRD